MNVYHLDDKTNVVVHVDTQDSEEVARVFQEKGYKVSGVFVKPE